MTWFTWERELPCEDGLAAGKARTQLVPDNEPRAADACHTGDYCLQCHFALRRKKNHRQCREEHKSTRQNCEPFVPQEKRHRDGIENGDGGDQPEDNRLTRYSSSKNVNNLAQRTPIAGSSRQLSPVGQTLRTSAGHRPQQTSTRLFRHLPEAFVRWVLVIIRRSG